MIDIELVLGTGNCLELEYVLRNPHSLVYTSPNYISLISQLLEAGSGWFVAKKDGRIAGLLPFIYKHGTLGPVYNSMAYYGSNGGVIQALFDYDVKNALINAFYTHARSVGACSATIITNPLEQDGQFYEEHTNYHYRDERIGLITHFPDLNDVETLINVFDDPRPRNIKRAISLGFQIKKNKDLQSLEFLHDVHVSNMEAIGGLPKSKDFFMAIGKNLPVDEWAVFTADIDGKPVAALLLLYFNKTVEYYTPVIVKEYRSAQPLALAIYRAMQDAVTLGYKNWNWGGTWLTQDGVYNFKKRWGTSEYRYYYFTQVYNQGLLDMPLESLRQLYPGFFLYPYNARANLSK